MGININDCTQDFTGQILRGEKTIETRSTRSLDPYIGERVGIVRTGVGKATLVGYATVGEPVVYDSVAKFRRDQSKHLVAPGSAFDMKDRLKYGYPLMQVEEVEPRVIESRGIVARKVNPMTSDSEYLDAVRRGDMETAQRMVDEAAKAAGYDIRGYHGTRSPVGFTKFTPNKALGGAIFVAVDPLEAKSFGRVMDVFIKAKNVRKGVVRSYDEVRAIDAAKQRGQDAIRVTDGPGAPINYAVFDPSQIKSADPVTYDDAGNVIPLSQRFSDQSDDIRNPYTRPDLRERLKRKIMAGSKGGNPGQWSARKAQLLAAEYEKAGGGYTGGRSKAQRSLSKWTKQDWRTKSGKPSLETGERYLPAAAITALSSAEYAATTRAKRKATSQFSRQPRRIAMKTKEFRNPVAYPKEEITYAALSPTPANKDIAAGKAFLETPAFKKWFGDSKVRDLAKRPMVVYHGTCASGFTEFDPTKTREMGFHFGTPPQAKDFLKGCGTYRGSKPGIYPVYLSIQNPIFTPDVYSEEPTYFIEWLEKTNHIHEWFPDENDSYYRSLNKLRDQLAEAKSVYGPVENQMKKRTQKAIWGLLRKIVTRKGYDGVRYKNENEGNTDDPSNIAWIAFSPGQIKSATENILTFDRRDPDIRNPKETKVGKSKSNPLLYPPDQVRAYETEVQSRLGFPNQTQLGADLELQRHRQWNTDEFRKWFGDSVVTKPNGAPLLVYHGTCRAGFTKFDPTKTREMGFHFGTWAQAKDFVGGCEKSEIPGVGPGVYPVYLSIQRALETPDLYSSVPISFIRWIEETNPVHKWFTGKDDPYFKKLKYLQNQASMAVYKFSGGEASELSKFLKMSNKKTWNHLKAIIMRKGYDGIRYKNMSEGNAADPNNIAWIAFSPAQVKSATDNRGTFNRRDAALDNPIPSMVRSKLSRIIEPGDRILCYDRAQGEDLYRLWDMIHTATPLTKDALVEIEGMLDDDGVLVIESGEEPPGLRDHFRKVIKYSGMLLVQGPMNPEEARINTEKLRRDLE